MDTRCHQSRHLRWILEGFQQGKRDTERQSTGRSGVRLNERADSKGRGWGGRGVGGVRFDALPKSDFPRMKPEAFETAGCRVGRSGFRVAAFTAVGERGFGGGWRGGGAACHL